MWTSGAAKNIALHFIEKTKIRTNKAISCSIEEDAEKLAQSGYKEEEITKVIDYIVDVEKKEIYSFMYIFYAINDTLRKINTAERTIAAAKIRIILAEKDKEVKNPIGYTESSGRNRAKLQRLGIQSRFREKSDIHLPEEHR